MATPAVTGTVTTFASASTGTTHTIPHNQDGTGGNFAIFGICYSNTGNNTAFTGATWNGTSASQEVSVVGVYSGGGIMYYLANPDSGSHNFVISAASARSCNAVIFQTNETAQSSPIDTTATIANVNPGTSLSKTITTGTDGSLIIQWAILNSTATSVTPDGSQTEQAEFNGNSYNRVLQVQTLPKETAGAQATGITWTTSTFAEMFTTSILYQASAGGAADNALFMQNF